MFPPRLEDLQLPDGSLLVPARVAARMLKLLELGVVAARQRGAASAVNLDMEIVLDALHEAAEEAGSGTGTTVLVERRLDASGKLLGTQGAADRIGCSERAVRKAIAEGRLNAVRVGRAWLIGERELDWYRFGGDVLANEIQNEE